MDTANKISIMSKDMGFPIVSLGIPKTVDNDLPITDNCPGFGSVAKYIAISSYIWDNPNLKPETAIRKFK